MLKTAVIYHKLNKTNVCPDGFASAWVARKALGHLEPQFIGCIHGDEPPNLEEYNTIYIIDFSFSREVLTRWKEEGKEVILIDHHIGAFRELSNFNLITTVFDMKECGDSLTPVLLQKALIDKWTGDSLTAPSIGGYSNSTPVIINAPNNK